jgi:hypothetical protein
MAILVVESSRTQGKIMEERRERRKTNIVDGEALRRSMNVDIGGGIRQGPSQRMGEKRERNDNEHSRQLARDRRDDSGGMAQGPRME